MENSDFPNRLISIFKKLFNKRIKTEYSSNLINKVLNGIPDVIGVYSKDHTILFYNQAGYELYRTTPDEIKGKKCYEMLFRNQKCEDCPVDRAINSGKIVRKEKYVSKLNAYMDYCCNPVLDESGNILFVVELLRDISDKKKMDEMLKESGKNYRKMVNLSPDAILVTVKGVIELANHQAMELLFNPIGEKLLDYIVHDCWMKMRKGTHYIMENRTEKVIIDSKVNSRNGNLVDVQISASYFSYKGRDALLLLIRDVSKKNKEIHEVSRYQLLDSQKPFPLANKLSLETLYVPAEIISGDFYYFHKVDDNLVVGILGDICGKSFKAAMSISAFNILFHEAVLITHNPEEILKIINQKTAYYFNESYIAAICFSLDFSVNQAIVTGAGINQFIFQKSNDNAFLVNVEGTYLGMFDNSEFESKFIDFQSGDRFCFFSDGLSFAIQEDTVKKCFDKYDSIQQQKKYIERKTKEVLTEVNGYKDDCTMLLFEMR